MPNADDRPLNSPQSVARVIRILETLCAAPAPVSLAQLSRELHAPKSSIAALLRGLADTEFVTSSDGVYSLGPSAFGFGSALLEARRRIHSPDLVREGMRRLAERSGETVLFAVRDAEADTMTYLDVMESRNSVRFTVSVGDRRPLYCTAGGRVLLAAIPEADLRRYLNRLKAKKMTTKTEINRAKIAQAITLARTCGVAQTMDEAAEGVTGAAAAIRDGEGIVIGALVVAAPSSRLQDRRVELARLVREEAAAISRCLGHRMPALGKSSSAQSADRVRARPRP